MYARINVCIYAHIHVHKYVYILACALAYETFHQINTYRREFRLTVFCSIVKMLLVTYQSHQFKMHYYHT